MRLPAAFLRRDFQIAASYRLNFLFSVLGGLFTLTLFYFLARTMGDSPRLRAWKGDYFSYALLGIAVATSLRSLQASFAQRVRESQIDGSLEVLLAAPLTTFRVVTYLAAYPILSALVRSLALIAAGSLLFGARLSVDALGLGVSWFLTLVCFAALGLISAALVLLLKRADLFSYALDTANYLVCGVIYPVEVLPPFLQWVSKLLPATYALRALRLASLSNAGFSALLPSWGPLVLFAVFLWPLAAGFLLWARGYAERTGTLPHG